jgi:hypothetical protein
MGIEGIHVFVPGGEDGAFDKAKVLSIGSNVERAVNVVDEALGVVVQQASSQGEGESKNHKNGEKLPQTLMSTLERVFFWTIFLLIVVTSW